MDERKIALAKYRIDKAREELKSSKLLFGDGLFKTALSSAYYSMFLRQEHYLHLKELTVKSTQV